MTTEGNNIFLLEVIVYKVTLTDPDQTIITCPLCVCFRFGSGLVDLDICEGDFCDDDGGGVGVKRTGDGEVYMTRGKSCLFVVGPSDLCRTAREFSAAINVYRRVAQCPETRIVGQTVLEFDYTFTDLIQDPNQEERTRELRKCLPLYESGRRKPVGSLLVFVRLTSQGDLLVTQFTRDIYSNKFQYKGLNEYVPTNVPVQDCQLEYKCHKKKCRKFKKCCNALQPKYKKSDSNDNPDNCGKQIRQVNCILTVMEMMKDLFTKATMDSAMNSEEHVNTSIRNPCMFDPNCPFGKCPFRTNEPLTAVVDRMIQGNRPITGESVRPTTTKTKDVPKSTSTEEAESIELEDDADLFILKTGRVDQCRIKEPLFRDNVSQYLSSDLPADLFPLPAPVQKKKKSKRSKSKKKSKKPSKKSKKK